MIVAPFWVLIWVTRDEAITIWFQTFSKALHSNSSFTFIVRTSSNGTCPAYGSFRFSGNPRHFTIAKSGSSLESHTAGGKIFCTACTLFGSSYFTFRIRATHPFAAFSAFIPSSFVPVISFFVPIHAGCHAFFVHTFVLFTVPGFFTVGPNRLYRTVLPIVSRINWMIVAPFWVLIWVTRDEAITIWFQTFSKALHSNSSFTFFNSFAAFPALFQSSTVPLPAFVAPMHAGCRTLVVHTFVLVAVPGFVTVVPNSSQRTFVMPSAHLGSQWIFTNTTWVFGNEASSNFNRRVSSVLFRKVSSHCGFGAAVASVKYPIRRPTWALSTSVAVTDSVSNPLRCELHAASVAASANCFLGILHWQFTTISDDNFFLWLSAARRSYCFNFVHHIFSFHNFTKHHMFTAQPIKFRQCNKELGSISVSPSVGHGQLIFFRQLNGEVFISEFSSVDT